MERRVVLIVTALVLEGFPCRCSVQSYVGICPLNEILAAIRGKGFMAIEQSAECTIAIHSCLHELFDPPSPNL